MTVRVLPVLDQPDVVPCCAPLAAEVLSQPDADVLARQFAALADPVRLRLVSLLATTTLAPSAPAISWHPSARASPRSATI